MSPATGRSVRSEIALEDLDGVMRANVLWLLVPREGGKGAWVELGMAMARALYFFHDRELPTAMRRIIASGDTSSCIFLDVIDARFTLDQSALEWLQRDSALAKPTEVRP